LSLDGGDKERRRKKHREMKQYLLKTIPGAKLHQHSPCSIFKLLLQA
jgi:hypothetical protein